MIRKGVRTCRCLRNIDEFKKGQIYDYHIVIYNVQKRFVKYEIISRYCNVLGKKVQSNTIYLTYRKFKEFFVDVVTHRNKTIKEFLTI